jgi:DNA-binding LacI/PurR family transcriptional regulator
MTIGRVTISQVAREAGVSRTTVSHVLSGRGRVNAETKRRVEQTVRDLGYRANPLAINLRKDRFGAVGLYLPESRLSFEYYVDFALAASRAMFEDGCGLTLLPPTAQPDDLLTLPLDGVIVVEPMLNDPVIAALADSGMPLVLCEAAKQPHGSNVQVIRPAHRRALGELLDHLTAQGARKIAMLLPDNSVWWSVQLSAAARAWQTRSGRTVKLQTMPFACPPERARAAIDHLLDTHAPDALLIAQQGLGAAALAAAATRKMRVPKDLLVACVVDGSELLTTVPAITAVDYHPGDMGDFAARLLLTHTHDRSVTPKPQLVVRGSTTRLTEAGRR